MEFKGFQRVSLLDYPGKVAAIAFVGGCNLKCGFCYNRDLVLNSQSMPSVSEEEILGHLETNRNWLDGLVVTGGEPTIHPELSSFLEKVKKLGFSVKLDTNGTNPKMLALLLQKQLVDYVALDVKAPLVKERYQALVGVQANGALDDVRESIRIIRSSNGIDYEFRTTVVPELTKEDLLLIAGDIKGAKRYCLQQFRSDVPHVDERYSDVSPYSFGFLQEVQREIAPNFQICKVRGARLSQVGGAFR
ncbi:MAG TPA: anaerobic ribonucleoside-triphosphate reductase activating protein [Hadesarchaea archaeon]|nr:anaerobic ribonucleoside-triphosphate reductase activating protein [Hadesarchaea archaeon]